MITLHNVSGFARKTGNDKNGNQYIEFNVDYLAEESDGTCIQCYKTISSGWLCLDGGDEYCNKHIRFCNHDPLCKHCL